MSKDLDLWRFIASRLERGETVVLLVVAESSGSSPGRAGYKMAVAEDGEMIGSIGGGVMEVNLVEAAKKLPASDGRSIKLVEQVHRKNAEHASGMICSGRQTVLVVPLGPEDFRRVRHIPRYKRRPGLRYLTVTKKGLFVAWRKKYHSSWSFTVQDDGSFVYEELLREPEELYIIGGGHCALALSEVMSKLGFRISIFDDRPGLNTLAKNDSADEINIIDSYEKIATRVPQGGDVYVVVMTLGYASDAVVIRQLIDHNVRYFGVLGSKAKMAALMRELREQGYSAEKLERIRTPVGLPINSRTPEEIAVSIAAEIISVKNA
jgi:xanthine dehydrogenase accessory factor